MDVTDFIFMEEIPQEAPRPATGNKYRVTVHLFYYGNSPAAQKHVKHILLFGVEYDDVPTIIKKIYDEYFTSYNWHEIKTVSIVKDEIYVNGELI